METFVSIIIVGFNNFDDIQKCLNALSKSTYRQFHITICENGGRDAFDKLLSTIPEVIPSGQPVKIIWAHSNPGFAGGVNLALQKAGDADAFWILNPDTAPSPSALHYLVSRLGKGECDAVGCRMVLPGGVIQSYGGRWNKWLARSRSIGFGAPGDADYSDRLAEYQNYLNGASMVVSKHFIDAVGLMREDYFLYCEEVEWFLRAQKKGIKLGFASKAEVVHFHGTTTGGGRGFSGASRLALFLGERNRILVTRDTAPLLMPIVLPISLLSLLIQCLRHKAPHQLLPGAAGWWAGVRNVRGVPSFVRRNAPGYAGA